MAKWSKPNRWGQTFKAGQCVMLTRPNGEPWEMQYVGLAPPSDFSRAYGRQVTLRYPGTRGADGKMEAGYDDIKPCGT